MECKRCNSQQIVKNGKRRNGNQEYRCKECSHRLTSKEKIDLIHKIYNEKGEQRKIARILKVALSTVQYNLINN